MYKLLCKKNKSIVILALLPLIFYFGVLLFTRYNTHSVCIFKFLTDIDCPGCGITRAFSELFKLNFKEAYNYNPRIIIIAPMLFFIWISALIKKIQCSSIGSFKHSTDYHKINCRYTLRQH